ncbi:hypothetical protein JXB41_07440 [Candidatus Woesearchaeota archaeon]|nr:hypothetical protein [Candidatus Woesearchaeota archaeon]
MVSIPFLKKKEKEPSFSELSEFEQKKALKKMNVGDKLKTLKLGKEEFAEDYWHKNIHTKYPDPLKRYRFQVADPNINAQKIINTFVTIFGIKLGFNKTEKIVDSMGLSVGSSMFGNLAARLAAQQNQASQYLKGISEMIKGMFQIVREVRIIDERLQFYYDSDSENSELSMSSEIVLKGLWVDQVEGGSKNPGSVYGLSQTVGFTILPDVFFRTKPIKKNEIEKVVDAMKFNEKVKEILKRKLRQYYEWKERTKSELETRKRFVVKYLRQHYTTIKLYMSWITPYLRNIKRLKDMDKLSDKASVLNAFEQTLMEAETLHYRSGYGKYNAVENVRFEIKVTPTLGFHNYEYQHKGPIHVGRVRVTIRSYAWTDEQIDNYKKYKNDEELELMSEINSSIEEAMNALGDDLKKYLIEAGEAFPDVKQKKKEKPSGPTIFEPFKEVFGGFGELFRTFIPQGKKKKEEKITRKDTRNEERAGDFAKSCAAIAYQRFKELQGMMYW